MTILDILLSDPKDQEAISNLCAIAAALRCPDDEVIAAIKRAAALIHRAEAVQALQHLQGLRVETQKPAPGCDICGLLLCDGDDHR